MADLLAEAVWVCCATPAGRAATPLELAAASPTWRPVALPGTAASALRDAGVPGWETLDYDGQDWWFRAFLDAGDRPVARARLELDGVATLSEVYLNGALVASGRSMHEQLGVELALPPGRSELAVCCRALSPELARRRPRAPWRTRLVESQNLRFVRTSFFGRMPGVADLAAPVGPYRALRCEVGDGPRLLRRRMRGRLEGDAGALDLSVRLAGVPEDLGELVVRVGDAKLPVPVARRGDVAELTETLPLGEVERWWPHTHGRATRYPVALDLADTTIELGSVGFVTITARREEGGFALVVNGVPVFARGVCWVPLDPVRLAAEPAALHEALVDLRSAGMNLVRLPGTGVYEAPAFYEACDELGMLVWQDVMLANLEPPEEPELTERLVAELERLEELIGHRPSTAVLSGGSEIEQQAAMAGAARERWRPVVLEELIRAEVGRLFPGRPYVSSSPSEGAWPFVNDVGVAHYFGVGAYRRGLEDARRADVRFAAECLAFAIPPEADYVEEHFGAAASGAHAPAWKLGVPRDAGASWDFEDVTAHYVELLFPSGARQRVADAEWALDCARAAVVTCFTTTLSEWRRAGSRCAGAVVLAARDVRPGAGWGITDASGGRKCAWYAMRQVLAPRGVVLTDEGLNGLRCHVVNDTAEPLEAVLRVECYRDGALAVDAGELPVAVGPRAVLAFEAAAAFDGFVDLTWAYRFGPPSHDVVTVTLLDSSGVVAEQVYLPLGPDRPREVDLGLRATLEPRSDGDVDLLMSTSRLATFVVPELSGYRADDAWFHLAPGRQRSVRLRRVGEGAGSGQVRALNLLHPTPLRLAS